MKILICSLYVIILTHLSFSQWTSDPTVNTPICTSGGQQENIQIVEDGRGGAFLIWEDDRNGDLDIYAQHITRGGYKLWEENGLNITWGIGGDQSEPSVTSDGNGGFIITWVDHRTGSRIYAQRVSYDGVIMWNPSGVPICVISDSHEPKIIFDRTNNATIVWRNNRNGNYDIYAQKIDLLGNCLWTQNGIIISDSEYNESSISIMLNDDLDVLISFVKTIPMDPLPDYHVVVCASLNTEGIINFYTTVLSSWTLDYKMMVDDYYRGAVFVCEISYMFGLNPKISAIHVNSVGEIEWNNIIYEGSRAGSLIIKDGINGFIILWSANNSIYGQRIDINGIPLWGSGGKFIVSNVGALKERNIGSDGANGCIIVFKDNRNGNLDIFAQRINSDGELLWNSEDVPVSINENIQNNQVIMINNYYETIITWEDNRNGNTDIYSQLVTIDGILPSTACDTGVVRYNSPINKKENMGFKIPTAAKFLSHSLTTDDDGNIYITGYSEGSNTKYDYLTIKYNASGNLIWVARYDGLASKIDKAYAVLVDIFGNVYVTGESDGGSTKADIVTIKYNENGEEQWVSRYNNSSVNKRDAAYDIILSPFQDLVVVTGESDGGSTTKCDIITIGYNTSTGDEVWVKRYNGISSKNDKAYSMDRMPTGFVVVGESNGGSSKSDIISIKYDYSGNEQWVYRYNSPYSKNDIGFKVKIFSNDVFVTGVSVGPDKNDMITLKLDNTGSLVWASRYNSSYSKNDIAYDLVVDENGDVYIAGTSESAISKYDYATIKYSGADGSIIWENIFDGGLNKNDIARSLTICNTNRKIYVTGSSETTPGNKIDFLTLSLDALTGSLLWNSKYNGPASKNDISFNISTKTTYCCLVLTGTSEGGSSTKLDFTTILGGFDSLPNWNIQSVGSIVEYDEEVKINDYILSNNYPNPFNPTTNIRFELPEPAIVTLKLYNMLGQEIATLIDHEELDESEQEIEFNANMLASGIYFYRLIVQQIEEEELERSQTFITVNKMLLLK